MSDKNLRQERMAAVIHAKVAEFFMEHGRDWGISSLPLVDQVFVSPDLHNVQIWISFAPWKREKAEGEFAVVQKHLGGLKKALAEQVELRRFPDILLKLSDPDKTFRIIDILDKISGHGNGDQPNQGEADSDGETDSADGTH